MSQALSFWQQFIKQLPENKTGTFKQQNLKRFSEPGIILGLLTFILAMLIWNWKLLLAIIVGIVVMLLAYSIPKWDFKINWLKIRQSLQTANNRLLIAGCSGIFATLITYIWAVIWVNSPSIWIAFGATLQGFGTLITLALLLWQVLTFQTKKEEDYLQQLLNNLTETDSLKRLLAIRQLTNLLNSQKLGNSVQQDVINCLRLLLSKEEEMVIREAALNSLQTLELNQ